MAILEEEIGQTQEKLPRTGGVFRWAVSAQNSPAGLWCSGKTDKIPQYSGNSLGIVYEIEA